MRDDGERGDCAEGAVVDVPKDRSLLTIKQACALADVSRRTIYNWLKDNRIQYVRTAGGAVRIFGDSLFRAGNVGPAVQKMEKG